MEQRLARLQLRAASGQRGWLAKWMHGSLAERLRVGATINALISLSLALSALMLMWMVNDALESAGTAQSGSVDLVMVLIIALMAGTVAITVFAYRMVRESISEPFDRMTQAMTRLAAGERDLDLPDMDREDEIGAMARCLDFIRTATFKAAAAQESAKRHAEEELARQIEREEEHAKQVDHLHALADQFEKTVGEIVGNVASASSQLKTTSSDMAQTAENSSRKTGEVSSALEEATAGVTAAAAASDEFAMSIGEISRQASSSAELARDVSAAARKADGTITDLTDSVAQIGQIVELISNIAKRTNLLALNASIEAARGGEAGRGFAVVAAEVKDLATQTSRATEDVAAQIRGIETTTGASVSALRTIAKQIAELETTAVSIAAAVDQQSIAGRDLAQSIDLAAGSAEQVAASISGVRSYSEATGQAAEQVHVSASDLERQASSLRVQAQEFVTRVRAA